MQRRAFLSGATGVSGLLALAGCTDVLQRDDGVSDSDGDGVVDSQDYAPNDADVQEKSDLSTSTSGAGDSGSNSSDDNREQKQEILTAYDTGISNANTGTSQLEASISAYNDERYDEALSTAEEAASKYGTAGDKFEHAVNLSLRIGHQDAQEICTDAHMYAVKMQLGSQYSQTAAKAARNGNMERANEFAQRHREKVNEGRELTVKDPPVLKTVLDL